MLIRRASPKDAAILTEVAHEAKEYWGYPESWIQFWKEDLTITPAFIEANHIFLADSGDVVAGFYSIVMQRPGNAPSGTTKAELEHMWVKPEHIGAGVGRDLFLHALETAAFLNAAALEISADPNAEGFYKRMGATRIGEVHSEIEGQTRTLPRLTIDLDRG